MNKSVDLQFNQNQWVNGLICFSSGLELTPSLQQLLFLMGHFITLEFWNLMSLHLHPLDINVNLKLNSTSKAFINSRILKSAESLISCCPRKTAGLISGCCVNKLLCLRTKYL